MDRPKRGAVAEDECVLNAGPEHCEWQDVVFLEIGYRSGLTQPGLSGKLTFLRDSEGVLADQVVSQFEADIILPSDAVATGWQRDGQDLWLDPDGAAAYLHVGGEHFEKWPRARGLIACG